METVVVLITAGLAIIWSIRSYFIVGDRLGMREESAFRIMTIFAPSAYFLALVMAGWQREAAVRLDLIGMLVLDVIAVLALVSSLIVPVLPVRKRRSGSLIMFGFYHTFSLLAVSGTFFVRYSPVALISLNSILRRIGQVDVFSFAWIGQGADRQEQDIITFLNRVLIAVLSYVPIAVIRFLTGIRHRRRMEREIDRLNRRVSALEQRAERGKI